LLRNLGFITAVLLSLLVQPVFAQAWNCDDFIGDWKFEGDDYNMSAQRTVLATFSADRTFYVDMWHEGQNSQGRELQTGRWQCKNGLQTLHIESLNGFAVNYSDVYEIMELMPVYFRIRSTPENCDRAGSDCPTTYEYVLQ
jgi:hypothetical protein